MHITLFHPQIDIQKYAGMIKTVVISNIDSFVWDYMLR